MKQIKVRWGDLGSPTQTGIYRCGAHVIEVTPGDIKLANGNQETVFTAILWTSSRKAPRSFSAVWNCLIAIS